MPHPIPHDDKPDPKDAQALQQGLEGQFREVYHDAMFLSKHEL